MSLAWRSSRVQCFGRRRIQMVYTTGEIAKICRVAPRTVSKWFDQGRMKGYRIPGSNDRRIPRKCLIEFLRAHNFPLDAVVPQSCLLLVGVTSTLVARIGEVIPEEVVTYSDDNYFAAGQTLAEHGDGIRAVVMDLSGDPCQGLAALTSLKKAGQPGGPLLIALAGEDGAGLEAIKEAGFDLVLQHPVGGPELEATFAEVFAEGDY